MTTFTIDDVPTFEIVDGEHVTLTEEQRNEMLQEWKTEEEPRLAALPMELLRRERNSRLAETDWWANSDLTMTAEQTAYRQALRDITDTYTSLDDVVWPTKP